MLTIARRWKPSRDPSRVRNSSCGPSRSPVRCGYEPSISVARDRTSPLMRAIDPESSRPSTVWRSTADAGIPSSRTAVLRGPAPRAENSAEKSSVAVTPGIAWMARSGSSATRLRRSWISVAPMVCSATMPGSRRSNTGATTSTCSSYVPVPAVSTNVNSSAAPGATDTGLRRSA